MANANPANVANANPANVANANPANVANANPANVEEAANHGDIPEPSSNPTTTPETNIAKQIRTIDGIEMRLDPTDAQRLDVLHNKLSTAPIRFHQSGKPVIPAEAQELIGILSRAETKNGAKVFTNSDEILKRMLDNGNWNVARAIKSAT